MSALIRHPAVAGQFYPANSQLLQQAVAGYLAAAPASYTPPKAMIVPHAGYIYSAPIAATAYARLSTVRDHIHRVVLLGPAHRVGFVGLAVSHADFFNTPLGNVPLDKAAIEQILQLPFVQYRDDAHHMEHSLEVQLPFLQTALAAFELVPIVAGQASPEQVMQVLELFYDDPQTLIVISSDLSHYHDYATAQQLDRKTTEHIENLHYEALQYEDACGRVPIQGLLALAKQRGLQVQTIDLRNSGDTAGDKTRVVGYGAYIIN